MQASAKADAARVALSNYARLASAETSLLRQLTGGSTAALPGAQLPGSLAQPSSQLSSQLQSLLAGNGGGAATLGSVRAPGGASGAGAPGWQGSRGGDAAGGSLPGWLAADGLLGGKGGGGEDGGSEGGGHRA